MSVTTLLAWAGVLAEPLRLAKKLRSEHALFSLALVLGLEPCWLAMLVFRVWLACLLVGFCLNL